ncbi:MFS transporter [Nocardia sp. NPDC004711]
MEANIVTIAVPTIRAQLHAGADIGLWVIDAYTLTFAALLLTAGRIGDRIGPRRAYQIGLAVLGVASIGCALAPTPGWLVTARAVQGVGAALLAPAPLTLITRTYSDATARATAIGIWVSAAGMGMVIGPLLSGLLVDTVGWRSIFVLNVPVVAVAVWLVWRYVDEAPTRAAAVDPGGQILVICGLTALVWSLVESTRLGWASRPVLITGITGLAVLAGFGHHQLTRAATGHDVLLAPAVLTNRPVLAGLAVGAIYNFVLYGTLIVYTYDLQDLRHYSALRAGLALLPLTVTGIAVSSLIAGRFVAAHGPRTGVLTGMGCFAAGLVLLVPTAEHTPYLLIAAGLVATGVRNGHHRRRANPHRHDPHTRRAQEHGLQRPQHRPPNRRPDRRRAPGRGRRQPPGHPNTDRDDPRHRRKHHGSHRRAETHPATRPAPMTPRDDHSAGAGQR